MRVRALDRKGEPCRWDGRILERVVERIHELGEFSETDWNSRSVVEIAARKKTDGWFLHAITGEAWLLKLKFRMGRGTVKREELVEQGQRRERERRAEGIPVLKQKFVDSVKPKLAAGQWEALDKLCADRDKLAATPVDDFMALLVA